jgi:S-DNA-T family DNA segregation ATPase FtsK/SpoIIIE
VGAAAAGGHAGGVLGYTLGPLSMKALGFAGSGVLWIAALVAGLAMAFRFSWLSVAERIGAWFESLKERRVERIERRRGHPPRRTGSARA